MARKRKDAPDQVHPEADRTDAAAPVDPNAPIQPGGPPIGYIQAQRIALETRDRERNELINQLESIRFHTAETDPHIPEGFEKSTVKVRNPLLGDMVDRVTSALTMDAWRVRLDNGLQGPDDARKDGELERASNRLLDTMDRCAGRNVRRLATDQLVATGRTVVKVAHKADWFKRYPTAERVYKKGAEDLTGDETRSLEKTQDKYKRRGQLPFYWEDLDVRTYHEVAGGNGAPAECLVVSRVAKLPLMQRYDLVMMRNGALNPRQRALQDPANIGWDIRAPYGAAYLPERVPASIGTTSEWVEHWTADEPDEETGEVLGGWFTYLVDGQVVRQRRHNYARSPFFQMLGLSTSSRDPKFEALSVIFHIAGMSLLLDSFLTIGSNAAYFEGFGTYQEVINPQLAALLIGQGGFNSNPLAGRKTEIKPGQLMHPTMGEIKAVIGGGLSQAVDRMTQQTEMLINQAGISSVLKGSLSGDPSGWLASQLLTASLIGFFPITDGLAKGAAAVLDHVYRMTERIVGEDVYLGDAKVKHKELADYGAWNIAVDIKPRLPSNDIARGQAGDQGVAHGTISEKTNREQYWNIEDPVAEQDQIDIETAQKDPLVLEAKKKIAMFDPAYGIVQMLEHAAQVEQAFQTTLQQIQQPAAPAPAPEPDPAGGAQMPFQPGQNGAPLAPPEPSPGAGGGPQPGGGAGQPDQPPAHVTELPAA